MDWTDEAIMRLRVLWDAGLTTSDIGRRLGTTKNSVVGKAHRLELPSRASPIRRVYGPPPPRGPRKRPSLQLNPELVTSLPPLPSVTGAVVVVSESQVLAAQAETKVLALADILADEQVAVVADAAPIQKHTRASTTKELCCWPMGEPGTRSFRYCDEPAEFGKPYCLDHCAIAYIAPKRRRRIDSDDEPQPKKLAA